MARVRIRYNPLPKQRLFHEDIESDSLFFCGGLGSGKSYALAQKLLKLSWINKGFPGGLLSPSVQDFKRDMLPIFEQIFSDHGLNRHCYYHRQDACFKLLWTDKPLYVFTAERPIAGPNLSYCGINEPSIIKPDRINEMLRRVRTKDSPILQKCLAGTPEDKFGTLQDMVEKLEKKGKLRLIQASTKENHHIDDEYYQHLVDTLDPTMLKIMAEGELIFGGSNLFYYEYSKERNDTDITLDIEQPIYINLDFNVGNMHATICQIYTNDEGLRIAVFCDEIVIKDHGADTFAMINAIKARFPGMERRIKITCDFSGKARKTTGASDVKVLRNAFGYGAVRYRTSGNPRLRKRQILVNGLLSKGRILINREECPTLVKDLRRVEQEVDFSKKKANEDLTHSSDTLDYFCDFEFGDEGIRRYHEYKAM